MRSCLEAVLALNHLCHCFRFTKVRVAEQAQLNQLSTDKVTVQIDYDVHNTDITFAEQRPSLMKDDIMTFQRKVTSTVRFVSFMVREDCPCQSLWELACRRSE